MTTPTHTPRTPPLLYHFTERVAEVMGKPLKAIQVDRTWQVDLFYSHETTGLPVAGFLFCLTPPSKPLPGWDALRQANPLAKVYAVNAPLWLTEGRVELVECVLGGMPSFTEKPAVKAFTEAPKAYLKDWTPPNGPVRRYLNGEGKTQSERDHNLSAFFKAQLNTYPKVYVEGGTICVKGGTPDMLTEAGKHWLLTN